jgi:hypothetical protein
MQLYAAKRRSDFLATASYTWSKVLTDASNFNDNPEDAANRKYSYGPASFDRRHAFVATYTFAPSWFRNAGGFTRLLFDGFEISGITRYQSRRPYTVVGNTPTGLRRADVVSGADFYLKDGLRWLNPAAFAPASGTRRGSSSVGLVTGPSLQAWDFSIRKRFLFNENMDLRFQADVFNVFNRANFSSLDTNVSSPAFGVLNASGPGRSIQFGVKFGF